ncbi:MAG: hypothetical protein U5Q03_17660 [Bacteroidota bacterium]|nr:hypothetical protein [Bacteroidota bacterium]
MKSLFRLYILIFACWPVLALPQNKDLMRIEINASLENEAFYLTPCNETGFLVYYESVESFDENHTSWIFSLFGINMEQQWTRNIPVLRNARLQKKLNTENSSYLFFYYDGKIREGEFNLQVLKFDHSSKEFISVYGSIAEKGGIIDAEAYADQVFIALALKKYETAVYKASFKTSVVERISTSSEDRNLVEDIYFDKQAKKLNVIINHFVSRKENYLLIKEIDLNGNTLDTTLLRPGMPDIELNAARIRSLGKDRKIVLGTYNTGGSASTDLKNEEETISAGFFSAMIQQGVASRLKFYNFLDFENFTANIQSPGILRMKKKSEKGDEKEYSLNYHLLLHDIIREDSQLVFFAEVYYPEYRTVSYITYDYYGRPYPQSYTVFDGYKYLGGVAAGFNRQAIKIWDNGIKIWNIQTFNLSKKIIAFADQDELVLAYNSQGKIASEIYRAGRVVGDFEYVDLQTKYSKDRITQDVNSNMIHWYDNYFLCYGYQEIKNNALRDSDKRSVFYINKIAFD